MCAIYFLIFESKNIINCWLIPDTTRSYLFSRFLLISLPTEICTCFSSVHFLYVKLLTKLDFTVSCALYAFVYLTVCSEADSCWSAELAACFTAVCASHCRRQETNKLALTTFAARWLDVSDRLGCLAEMSKGCNFLSVGQISKKCWNTNWSHSVHCVSSKLVNSELLCHYTRSSFNHCVATWCSVLIINAMVMS